jgi:uncharacterized membrane protein
MEWVAAGPVHDAAIAVSPQMQKWLLICVVVTGIFLRFACLDRKVYWYDEAFTSLEVSGYSSGEATTDILTGRVVSGTDLERYQFPRADSGKTVRDTMHGLIVNEPQLTPAYFVVLREWSLLFPSSVAAARALSAIFSLAALAAGYWLLRELFPDSPGVAYVGVALMASSPFHILYAQEARPYAMWSAAALSLSALLLWAMRRRTGLAWILYGLCATLSLYTYLLSILVLAGHGLYVAIENRFQITAVTKRFALAAIGAVVIFLAWPYRGQHMGTGNDHYSLVKYALKWIRSIGIVFADFDLSNESSARLLIPYGVLILLLLALCGYSVWFLLRHASRRQWLFVLILMASLTVPLIALDLLKGSSQALVTRYMFPSFIALQIAVAYLLGFKTQGSNPGRTRPYWQASLALVLIVGLGSGATMVRAAEWWNKDPNNDLKEAARLINAAADPVVVINDGWFVPMLSLEHELRRGIFYQLTVDPSVPAIDPNARTVFAIRPSTHLRGDLQRCYQFEPADAGADLWRLTLKAECSR